MATIGSLCEIIEAGNFQAVEGQVRELLDGGAKPSEIINDAIVPTLDKVGRKFSDGLIFVPEMLVAAKCSQKALDIIKPLLNTGDYKPRGTVVIGTVKGDLHDIGKNIVAMVFEAAGFEVHDLGVDVSPEKFLDALDAHGADVVALSCLLTTTVPAMNAIVKKIRDSNQQSGIKVIVGGPPVTDALAQQIGADFYGKDAYSGVELIRNALGG